MSKFGEPSSGRLVKQTTSNGTESRECAGCMRALPLRARFDCSVNIADLKETSTIMKWRFASTKNTCFSVYVTRRTSYCCVPHDHHKASLSLMTVKLFVGVCSLFKVITMFVPSGYVANYMAPVSFVESAPQSKHTPSPSQKDLHLRGIVDSPPAQKMTGDVQQRGATTMTRHARDKWAREAEK